MKNKNQIVLYLVITFYYNIRKLNYYLIQMNEDFFPNLEINF